MAQQEIHKLFSALVVYPYYHHEPDDVPAARFFKFDEADLDRVSFDCETRQVEAVLLGKDGSINPHRELPTFAGICRVGSRLFLYGGMPAGPISPREDSLRRSLWSFDHAATSPGDDDDRSTWSLCAETSHVRVLRPLAVPYQGRVLIFGAEPYTDTCKERWVEIYDPESGQMLEHRVLPDNPFAAKDLCRPCAYFLWAREGQEKPLIVLDLMYIKNERPHRLVSYDAEANLWETIHTRFPATGGTQTRTLIPFGGSTLLIIDYAFEWYVYDMNYRYVTGELTLPELKQFKRDVKFAYHKPGPDTSLYVYVFLEYKEYGEFDIYPTGLPYAKVKVVEESPGKLRATVESQGVIAIGEYLYVYIFDGELEPGVEPGDEEKKAREKAQERKKLRRKMKKLRRKMRKREQKMKKRERKQSDAAPS